MYGWVLVTESGATGNAALRGRRAEGTILEAAAKVQVPERLEEAAVRG